MSYECKILADSVSPDGVRLTTIQATFPRFILAEVNTHRMLSRNSASSRAIPPEKLIERVRGNAFVPETFNKRVKGMGVGDALESEDMAAAKGCWLGASENACRAAEYLMNLDCDKSRINRLLEPFMWHTAIISATEWDNFFALRCHPDAQPEFRIIAEMMRDVMIESSPDVTEYGCWHLPLVSWQEIFPSGVGDDPAHQADWAYWAYVSAGRCARVSFDTHDRMEEDSVSYQRAERLKTSGHLSPFEHIARPIHPGEGNYYLPQGIGDADPNETFVGNLKGWVQMRKQIPNESNFAEVVKV